MKINYKVLINKYNDPSYANTAGTNKFTSNKILAFLKKVFGKGDCFITFNLGNFGYRKNISYKKVVKDVNNYFLVEFICLMTRYPNIPLCGSYGSHNCPIDNVWSEMKLRRVI